MLTLYIDNVGVVLVGADGDAATLHEVLDLASSCFHDTRFSIQESQDTGLLRFPVYSHTLPRFFPH